MTRVRTKKARLRVRKYRRKFRPRVVNLVFKENVAWQSINLRDYLRLDNLLEKETLDLLEKNVKLGLITEEQKDLYLAFWRKALSEAQRYSSLTLEKDLEELVNEFETRGLLKSKLLEIVELVKDQLPRKEFFHVTKEWAVLQDWLKFKAMAYVTPLTKFELDVLPFHALEFYYRVVPLAYRVFSLTPKARLQLIKYVLPLTTRLFSLDLRNKITLELLYEISRYYTFTFTLRPKYRLIYDYEVLVSHFRRFQLTPTVSYQFFYDILALTTRVFTISDFYTISLIYSVTPLPLRIFTFQKFYKLSLIYYTIPPYLMLSEITPLPRLIFTAKVPTTEVSKTELKPKVSVQFSYTTRPA